MKHRTSIAAALLLLMFLLSNTCTAYAAENLTLKRTTVALGLGEKPLVFNSIILVSTLPTAPIAQQTQAYWPLANPAWLPPRKSAQPK